MKSRSRIISISIAVITLTALAVFIITFTQAAIKPPREQNMPFTPPVAVSQSIIDSSSIELLPEQLIIPIIGINTSVQHVGISRHGTMAVPTNYTDVGWYRYGTIPGNQGSAVFAGHLDNGFGLAGVFKKLKSLKEGDDIYVGLENESQLHFKVISMEHFDQDTASTDSIFSTTGIPRIKLITCDGEWDSELKTYSRRYVVTAEMVTS